MSVKNDFIRLFCCLGIYTGLVALYFIHGKSPIIFCISLSWALFALSGCFPIWELVGEKFAKVRGMV